MKYSSVKKAVFINRPNRFVAHVMLDGREEIVHVKNTGRCKEILKAGATVFLEKSANKGRKTGYSLISSYKGDVLINIDSQVPNVVIFDAIKEKKLKELNNVDVLRREVTYGNSRFDIYFESPPDKGFIEVKGVTLEKNGVAMFPDAPTERGTKHIYEMIKAVEDGYKGYVIFVIQMKGIDYFTPNEAMDKDFAEALRTAEQKGVTILAYDCHVTEDEIVLGDRVDVAL